MRRNLVENPRINIAAKVLLWLGVLGIIMGACAPSLLQAEETSCDRIRNEERSLELAYEPVEGGMMFRGSASEDMDGNEVLVYAMTTREGELLPPGFAGSGVIAENGTVVIFAAITKDTPIFLYVAAPGSDESAACESEVMPESKTLKARCEPIPLPTPTRSGPTG